MPTKVLFETSASATGGRDGRAVTTDGSLDLKLTMPNKISALTMIEEKKPAPKKGKSK